MDAEQILNLFNNQTSELSADVTLFQEEADILRFEVVSSQFRGIRLSKRIDMVSVKILDLCQNEFSDYSVVINPLTKIEKEQGISETKPISNVSNDNGMVASQPTT
ncbi:MAG: hypothetical protein ACJAS4_000018 [Bacteriovoracaceae bacterium]|jgi:hypothetical protein